jgi:synaptobrevin family protein YKT6
MNCFGTDILLSSKTVEFPALETYIRKFQNPQEADSIMRVRKELDDTKVVLHKTLENLLERGEKLDDLVSRSDQLGIQSKLFYRNAKKTNSCCVIQ